MATKKSTDVNIKGVLNSLEDTTKETNTDTEKELKNDTENNTTDSIKANTKFILKKKVDDKKDKKAFNVYMPPELIKELDKLSKKSGYSRNELINLMCQYCTQNLELIEE